MDSFTDEEVLEHMNRHYQCCRDLPRVNPGQSKESRGYSANDNAHRNWIMWRREARERGLV